ncbi:MAG: hypothetical protein K2X66_18490 [Cyanobacteria bacterium]|nr:hypothetical protein [Cyanobacteriota bacterium]
MGLQSIGFQLHQQFFASESINKNQSFPLAFPPKNFATQNLKTVPSDLLKLYFGAVKADKSFANKSIDPKILKAVDWYDETIEKIPVLDRVSRQNHRIHLKMMGQILGLLPPVSSAQEALRLYIDVFNAVEKKVAPTLKSYRMICDEKRTTKIAASDYKVLHHGFYILVFAPNGAIESFRRNPPPSVEIDGVTETDFKKRLAYFGKTAEDYETILEDLQRLGKAQENSLMKMPKCLASRKKYQRTVFKTSASGQDAWNQIPSKLVSASSSEMQKAFQDSLKSVNTAENIQQPG